MKKTQRYKNDLNDIDDRDLSDKLEVVYLHVFVYVLELSVIERTAVLMVYDKYEKNTTQCFILCSHYYIRIRTSAGALSALLF